MHAIFGYAHARARSLAGRFRGTEGQRGQGTVEYVGLILLVSMLMVGMVVAMRNFNRPSS